MQETHAGVCQWTDENFGPASSNFRIATRANEELAEALRAIGANPTDDHATVEAADTIIVLCRLAKAFGLDWGAFEVDPRVVPVQFEHRAQYFTWANKWMAQLLIDLATDDAHECAPDMIQRIYWSLQTAIRQWDIEPVDVIEAKMMVNRGRTWKRNGDGTGYHVRPEKLAPIERPGLKGVGTFMTFPVFVAAGMPDDILAVMTENLNGNIKARLKESADRMAGVFARAGVTNLDAFAPRDGLGKISLEYHGNGPVDA